MLFRRQRGRSGFRGDVRGVLRQILNRMVLMVSPLGNWNRIWHRHRLLTDLDALQTFLLLLVVVLVLLLLLLEE